MSRRLFGPGRPGWRNKVESRHAIDIRTLARDGCLVPGSAGSIYSDSGDEGTLRVSYVTEAEDSIRFWYWITLNGAHRHEMDHRARITFTYPHLGGRRPWFACPDCQARVALLYMDCARLACRKCLNLIYSSQAEQPWDRARRMADRILARLIVGDDDLIYKPSRMRWETFERLYAQYIELEDAAQEGMLRTMARLLYKAA